LFFKYVVLIFNGVHEKENLSREVNFTNKSLYLDKLVIEFSTN